MQCNRALGFREEDCILRRVREKNDQEERHARGDSAEEEEKELPASNSVDLDATDSVGNDAADDSRDAVSEEPRGLTVVR